MRFGSKKHKKSIKNFGVFKKVSTFALAIGNYPIVVLKNAEIAQLVEHNLAKVGVASSSLVFRSKSEGWLNADLFLFLGLKILTSAPNSLSQGQGIQE